MDTARAAAHAAEQEDYADHPTEAIRGRLADMAQHGTSLWITCADGYALSVLAGPLTRCRSRHPGPYTHVEVLIGGGAHPPGWEQYDAAGEGFYGFVPVGLVQRLIDAHGGES
jgi:hypothetical protein